MNVERKLERCGRRRAARDTVATFPIDLLTSFFHFGRVVSAGCNELTFNGVTDTNLLALFFGSFSAHRIAFLNNEFIAQSLRLTTVCDWKTIARSSRFSISAMHSPAVHRREFRCDTDRMHDPSGSGRLSTAVRPLKAAARYEVVQPPSTLSRSSHPTRKCI